MTFDLRGLSHPAQAFLNATPSMQSLAKRTRYNCRSLWKTCISIGSLFYDSVHLVHWPDVKHLRYTVGRVSLLLIVGRIDPPSFIHWPFWPSLYSTTHHNSNACMSSIYVLI